MTLEPHYTFKSGALSSHSQVLRLAGDGNRRTLIEVGCGSGHLLEKFAANGWIVTGIEPEEIAANAAMLHSTNIFKGLLEQFESEERWDCVVAADVLEHSANGEQFLNHLKRLMKPQGRLILSVPNVAHFTVRLKLFFGVFSYSERGILDRTHKIFFTYRTICDLLEKVGFEITRESISSPPIEFRFPRFSALRIGKYFNFVVGALPFLNKRLFSYQFIFECSQAERT